MTDYEDLGHTSCPGDPAHRDALTVPPRQAEQEAERRGYLRGVEDAATLTEGEPLPESPKHYTRWPSVGDGDAANDSDRVLLARKTAAAIRALAKEKPHAD